MVSTLKKKDKMVKKLKSKLGEAVDEEEEEEEEEEMEGQGPLALTQGMGEDKEEEGAEEEEAEEAPIKAKLKKRKAQAQLIAKPKAKKATKSSPTKPTTPTRASTRATTQKAKEKTKVKTKTFEQKGPMQKKKRRKYVAPPEIDDEEDTSQFWVVIHSPKFDLENICDNIKDNADMTRLKNINFGKLAREEKNKVEELVYAMMAKFKTTPLELDNSMPKELYSLVENKWNYCLNLEKDIRE